MLHQKDCTSGHAPTRNANIGKGLTDACSNIAVLAHLHSDMKAGSGTCFQLIAHVAHKCAQHLGSPGSQQGPHSLQAGHVQGLPQRPEGSHADHLRALGIMPGTEAGLVLRPDGVSQPQQLSHKPAPAPAAVAPQVCLCADWGSPDAACSRAGRLCQLCLFHQARCIHVTGLSCLHGSAGGSALASQPHAGHASQLHNKRAPESVQASHP